MSSILDALRKLEQEKAAREQPAATAPLQELALEPEFELGRESGGVSSLLKRTLLIVAVLLVAGGIGAGLFAGTSMFLRREAPVRTAEARAPIEAAAVTTSVKPVDLAVADHEPEPGHAPPKTIVVASAAPPKPVPTKGPEPKTKTEPAAKQTAPKPPVPPAKPEPVAAAPPAEPAAPVETDIEKLPILSEATRVRLGLPALKINIVGIPSNRNPRASALINMQKVYVGETIPGTSARLMDVNLRGVALDINGQRYFLSRR